MKRLFVISALGLALGLSLGGCATANAPVNGFLFSSVSAPVAVGPSQDAPTKVGRATARSLFGIYAIGDASIQTAAKNGGITKIQHVDAETQSILGVIADYTTVVYGN